MKAIVISICICAFITCTEHRRCSDIIRKEHQWQHVCTISKHNRSIGLIYTRCLRCSICSLNQSISIQSSFHCIELDFHTMHIFEQYFRRQRQQLQSLFPSELHETNITNSLYIRIDHDEYTTLNLTYLRTILAYDNASYSYLYLTLLQPRRMLELDLETDRTQMRLIAVQLTIVCSQNVTQVFVVYSRQVSTMYSMDCVVLPSNTTRSSSTVSNKIFRTINTIEVLLVLTLSVLSILMACLSIFIYRCYRRWRTKTNQCQRLSFASSMFSSDSSDNQPMTHIMTDKNKTNQARSKQVYHSGLYSFDDDF
jgi:hypothetical protein